MNIHYIFQSGDSEDSKSVMEDDLGKPASGEAAKHAETQTDSETVRTEVDTESVAEKPSERLHDDPQEDESKTSV